MPLTALALAASLSAQAAGPARSAVLATPYHRTFQAHPYPFPVQSHRFTAQGQDLEMAYMDAAPEGAPKGTVVLGPGEGRLGGGYAGGPAHIGVCPHRPCASKR